jgi:hypothetical protein
MMVIQQGTWVQIYKVVLEPSQRAPQVPEDTKLVPLEMWVKGILLADETIGNIVKIKTLSGRVEEGKLVEVNPTFTHNYGNFIPEILKIGSIVKQKWSGDDQIE